MRNTSSVGQIGEVAVMQKLLKAGLDNETAFVVPAVEVKGKAVFRIRLSPSRSGQVRGTHPAEEYRECWEKLDMV